MISLAFMGLAWWNSVIISKVMTFHYSTILAHVHVQCQCVRKAILITGFKSSTLDKVLWCCISVWKCSSIVVFFSNSPGYVWISYSSLHCYFTAKQSEMFLWDMNLFLTCYCMLLWWSVQRYFCGKPKKKQWISHTPVRQHTVTAVLLQPSCIRCKLLSNISNISRNS